MVELDGRPPFHRRRPCAFCCAIASCIIVLIVIIIIILAFTVFKVKKAEINVEKIELQDFSVGNSGGFLSKPSINITLAVVISVHNPNRAAFKYSNSSAMVYYHDEEVAIVPIPAGMIGSQGTETISTTLKVLADKLATNSHLLTDALGGSLPFTTKTMLSGRVKILFVKKHVDISSQCSVSIAISVSNANASVADTDCVNKAHL